MFDVERRGKHANGGRRTAGNGHAKAAPGGVISGVYKAGTHEVINIDSCEIEDELSSAIIRDIRGLLHSFKNKKLMMRTPDTVCSGTFSCAVVFTAAR